MCGTSLALTVNQTITPQEQHTTETIKLRRRKLDQKGFSPPYPQFLIKPLVGDDRHEYSMLVIMTTWVCFILNINNVPPLTMQVSSFSDAFYLNEGLALPVSCWKRTTGIRLLIVHHCQCFEMGIIHFLSILCLFCGRWCCCHALSIDRFYSEFYHFYAWVYGLNQPFQT